MSNRFRAALVCLVLAATALVLFGCSSGDLASLIGSGAFLSTPKVAVVANYDTGTVGSYTINPSTGALSEIAASPYATSMTTAWGIAVHPNGKWVYVADDSNPTSLITALSVDNSTGALTVINTISDTNDVNWDTGVAVTQDGKWLLSADCNSNISVFAINQTTGALSHAGTPTASPAAPPSCLNSINVVNSKYVYVSGFNSSNVWGFSINSTTGALTELPGSPFAVTSTPIQPYTQVADLTGSYLYVADESGNIYAAKIGADGSLTPIVTGFPVSLASGNSDQLAIDPRNKFLYAPDSNVLLYGWSLNATTGALTPIPGSPWNTGGSSGNSSVQNVVVDPSGKFVYTSNWGNTANSTAGFSIDQTTGALSPIPGSPFPNKGNYVNSMVITH